ncbi:MAG: oligosaccharide flippase family protein [Deltaproteobacteria bacterium]|nr:oligosaccharide flippase family protein [Deltaproteobacteria bacterium]
MGDGHLRELVRGSSVALFSRIANLFLGYGFVLLITHNFGAKVMGMFALATTVATILATLARSGLDTALLRFVAEYVVEGRSDLAAAVLRKAWRVVLLTSLFLSACVYVFAADLAVRVFHKRELGNYIRLASMAVLPLTFSYVNAAYLRGLKKIQHFAFIQNVSINLFGILSVLPLFLLLQTNNAPLAAYVLGTVVTLLISTWFSREGITFPKIASPISVKEMLSVSLPLLVASSMVMITGWADIIMLGIFRSKQDVGIYAVIMKLGLLTAITLRAVNAISAPKFAELYKTGDLDSLQEVVYQATKMIFWSSLPLFLLLLCFPSPVLALFGNEFPTGSRALQYIALGMFVSAICGSVGIVLQMTGKQHIFQNVMIITMLLNIGLNLLLIPPFGIEGAAVASMIAVIFRNITFVIYVRQSMALTTLYLPGLKNGAWLR